MVDTSITDPSTGAAQAGIFQILRDGTPRTRSELAEMTGLARSTVAARVNSLIRAGLVTPVAAAASTGGRPSRQFAFDPTNYAVLGVDVGATHIHIAVTDLSGTILADDSVQMPVADGPERVLGWVIESGTKLFEPFQKSHTLKGIGVGLPGPVEHSTGRPVDPPIMPGWDRYDVRAKLTGAFGIPALVDNDVNVMGLGEHHGHWSDVEDLLFIKVATGIGAGVIVGGSVHRGAQGIAGDLGHIWVPEADGVPCRCGSIGCLEAIAAGPAIATRLRERGLDVTTTADVVAAVLGGEIEAVREVREAGRIIGRVLTTCVSLINPAVIALGGTLANAGDHLLAGAREVIYTRATPLAASNLQIVRSKGGSDAAVHGAAVLAIQHILSPESVLALVREHGGD